ncbi:hypothetical protein ABFA07_001203 [Porites harrisoni]
MCGRTACTLAPDEIPKACRYKGKDGKTQEPQWRDGGSGATYYPSHNISPQSFTPVLLSSQHFNDVASEAVPERVLQPMRWGLIPSWFHGNPKEFSYNMSNARSDSLLDKKSFRTPLETGKRCVILAEGFFEWETVKKGKKQPYYIYFKGDGIVKPKEEGNVSEDDTEDKELASMKKEDTAKWGDKRLLTMAGLFDHWKAAKDVSGEVRDLFSYTIITVNSSSSLDWLHDRMPAILDGEEEVRQWLDYGEVPWKKALELVKPKDCLEWHPVSSVVNNSRNKSPECIQPIDLSKQKEKPVAGTLLSYFKRSPKKEEKTSTEEPLPKKTKFQGK